MPRRTNFARMMRSGRCRKRRFEQVTDRNCGESGCRLACLEADEIWLVQLDFGCVLYVKKSPDVLISGGTRDGQNHSSHFTPRFISDEDRIL